VGTLKIEEQRPKEKEFGVQNERRRKQIFRNRGACLFAKKREGGKKGGLRYLHREVIRKRQSRNSSLLGSEISDKQRSSGKITGGKKAWPNLYRRKDD